MILKVTKADYNDIIHLMETNKDVFSTAEIRSAKHFLENSEDVSFYKRVDTATNILACGGFNPCRESDSAFELCYLVVHGDYQGMGIGTRLYNYIERKIIALNGKLILAEAGSKEKNEMFYKKQGFKIAGIIPRFYSPKKDLIQYYKVLKDKT
jgi:ribosomal protein S18 acetylase RimI-like enzyme